MPLTFANSKECAKHARPPYDVLESLGALQLGGLPAHLGRRCGLTLLAGVERLPLISGTEDSNKTFIARLCGL